MATHLPLAAKTLYAELREQIMAADLDPQKIPERGSFVTKMVKGEQYGYYQFRDLAGNQRQHYLGPLCEPDIKSIKTNFETRSQPGESFTQALAKGVREFTGSTVDATTFKVMQAFSDAGFFSEILGGSVLVGTHAFNALAPLLGVKWDAMTVTNDIDIAANDSIKLAVRPLPVTTPKSTLESLKMGFAPIPAMSPKSPSTSFQTPKGVLRVDLLTTSAGKPGGKAFIPALNSYAERVMFMDYLLTDPIRIPLLGPRKAILVNTPSPERFSLHKIIVSENRPAVMTSKSEKDRRQALEVLRVLLEENPDSIEIALTDLVRRGKGWCRHLTRGLERCKSIDSETAHEIIDMKEEAESLYQKTVSGKIKD